MSDELPSGREFMVRLLELKPMVTVAPAGKHELATRDIAIIDQWEAAGEKLEFIGIRLKR